MNEGTSQYPTKCQGKKAISLQSQIPSLEEDLGCNKKRLEEQVADINRMQELLRANPEIAEFENLKIRTRHIRYSTHAH